MTDEVSTGGRGTGVRVMQGRMERAKNNCSFSTDKSMLGLMTRAEEPGDSR